MERLKAWIATKNVKYFEEEIKCKRLSRVYKIKFKNLIKLVTCQQESKKKEI